MSNNEKVFHLIRTLSIPFSPFLRRCRFRDVRGCLSRRCCSLSWDWQSSHWASEPVVCSVYLAYPMSCLGVCLAIEGAQPDPPNPLVLAICSIRPSIVCSVAEKEFSNLKILYKTRNNHDLPIINQFTLRAKALKEIVLAERLSAPCISISRIQASICAQISCLLSQKWVWITYKKLFRLVDVSTISLYNFDWIFLTSLKHGQGFLTWSSIAHLTVAWQTFALYSWLDWAPLDVPRERSYPGSLKYGSDTNINDWIDTNTC